MIPLFSINSWWDGLSAPHQVFWFIAIVFSVLFFIQFVLVLIGFETHDASGADVHGDLSGADHEFSALSIKSIIAFFTFFGWAGVLALQQQLGVWVAVTVSTVAGLAAMFIVAYLMYKFSQLEQSGTLNLYHALDQEGEVYLSIPGHQQGQGKIHLQIDGRLRELDAVTDGERLKTGSRIRVTEILDDRVMKVEALEIKTEDTRPSPFDTA